MNKYILLYMAPITAEEQMQNAGPEDAEPWMAWFNEQGTAIVEMGNPLVKELDVTESGSSKAQSQHVTGYSIVQAADMDSVQAMIASHPHLKVPGASIKVLELMIMSM